MAAFLHDRVYDNGLSVLSSEVNLLVLCKQVPVTYAEAFSTHRIASKSSPSISAPQAGDPNGRQVMLAAITDGVIEENEEPAVAYALLDTAAERLLAVNETDEAQVLYTSNETFTTAAVPIRIPAPA